MSQTSEKRIAITGAASGLGRAIALYYAKQGWKIALGDVHDQRGQETLESVRKYGVDAFYQHVDVREDLSIEQWKEAIVKRWNGLDIIVNNAGVAAHGCIDEAPLDDWDWIIDINLMGVVRGCRQFSALFKKQGYGHIVNVASIAGLIHSPEMNSYNVTKAGVVALSDTLRSELRPFHISVSVVCPGFFQTNLTENTRSPNPKIASVINKLFSKSKINADDIAKIVYESVAAEKFFILPHKDFAAIWYLKRMSPGLYFWAMNKYADQQFKAAKKQRTKA